MRPHRVQNLDPVMGLVQILNPVKTQVRILYPGMTQVQILNPAAKSLISLTVQILDPVVYVVVVVIKLKKLLLQRRFPRVCARESATSPWH